MGDSLYADTQMVCKAGLQSRASTAFHLLAQLAVASTTLCMIVDIYLRAPVLSLTFLPMMEEEFPPDTVTIQNTISLP